MAKKKDFSEIGNDVNMGSMVFSTIETGTAKRGQQGEANPQEKAARATQLRTQGRKGCKAVRINMAFSPENHEFIRILSKIHGKTMTEFANDIIAQYRIANQDTYEAAKKLIDKLQ